LATIKQLIASEKLPPNIKAFQDKLEAIVQKHYDTLEGLRSNRQFD
jgi:hypothetical protein